MAEPEARRGDAGFSLIETLIAMMVLIFGLIGVANLFMVASTSNFTASRATAAATLASEQLDALRTAPYDNLDIGGTLGSACLTCGHEDPYTPPAPTDPGCPGGPGNHSCTQLVPGVGTMDVSWTVEEAGPNGRLITVEAVPVGVAAGWARVRLTTIRTCTAPPPGGAAAGAGPCPDIIAP